MSQANIANMKRQIDRISKEVTLMKRVLLYEGIIDKKKPGLHGRTFWMFQNRSQKSGKGHLLLKK